MRRRIPMPVHAGCQRVLAAVLLVVFLPLLAFAAELPAVTGRIVDNAGLLDSTTKAALTRRLEDFEKKSSDQIVIATVPDLGGDDIESYANRLFRAWGLGQAGENNGVLLLVARDDRKMRIEVGYGLEGSLTDLHSKLIIENTMVPAFRAGDYSGGVTKAVDDIVMVLEGDGAELEARARRNEQTALDEAELAELIFVVIFLLILFGSLAIAILPLILGRKIGPGRYRWLGMNFNYEQSGYDQGGRRSGGGYSGGGGDWSSGGGGFSGGGGSSGGGGASGSW